MTKYRAFSTGVKSRKLLPLDENYLATTFEIIEKNPDKDYYESIYIYNQEHFDKFKTTGSLAGIEGVRTDKIVFDFDSKKDVDQARKDAVTVVERLLKANVPEASIRAAYSGSKGMHVEVHLDDTMLSRPEFEAIVSNYAGDLSTFDTKISDEQRLFRYPLTRHNSTNRYKIPLSLEQLNTLSIEQIEKLSLNTDHNEFIDILSNYSNTKLFVDPKSLMKKEKKTEVVVSVEQGDRPDMSRKPKHLTPAKFALQEGYFQEGERNEACMILASTYKYLQYSKDHTYNIIKATLRMRSKRLGFDDYDKKELWETIIEPVYSPLWKGGTFSEDEGLLKLTIDRYGLDKLAINEVSLVDLSALSAHFMDFAVNIDANTIKLGIEEIDKKLRITTSSLVAFLAAPSAGKSSVSFGILNTVSKSGEKSIFFSMDMSIPQVYQRLIQRHTGHDEDRIMANYTNNVTLEIDRYQNVLNEEYPNVKFCFKSGMSVDDVRTTILFHQQNTGIMPRLVVLDYLECMRAEGVSDSAQSKAQIATALKGTANELGICIILLVQPRMMAGGPAGELNSYTDIKGSSVISEAAAQVITMSRPGFSPKNPEDDNYVTINVVKNRMGKLSSTDLHWDGLTGHIRSLSSEEENDLKALRSAIASEKNDKDDNGGLY